MKLSNSFIAVKKITSSIPISNFSKEDLNRAAESILKAEGVINPLVLRRTSPQSYEVVDGHFEYYAATKAKEIDSKKGEYIGAFVIDPENEEILQQQVELLRNRDSNDIEMKKKLENLTAQVADLTKSVKRIEELESLTAQVVELAESVEKIQKDLSNKLDKERNDEAQNVKDKSQKSEAKAKKAQKAETIKNESKKSETKTNKSQKSEATTDKSKKSETTANKSQKLDYDNMAVPELKAIAKEQKLAGYSKMNRGQLIAELTSDKKD